MCTLSYIPKDKNYILTSNRDEHDSRALTKFPVIKNAKYANVYFPQDPLAGGTWLASSNNQRTSVLLNGAFESHAHLPPYRLSRGIVLLDSFDYPSIESFIAHYRFHEVEPFTLISFNSLSSDAIDELRWDGEKVHYKLLDAGQAHIWSSTMLYSEEVRKQREEWFSELLKSDPNADEMSHFHHFGGYADMENSLKMDRGNGLRTISISQLVMSRSETSFNYQNLVTDKGLEILIPIV